MREISGVALTDLRYMLRLAWRHKWGSGAATVALSATVAVAGVFFGMVHAIEFAGLPFPSPDRLVYLSSRTGPPANRWRPGLSPANASDLRGAAAFEGLAFYESVYEPLDGSNVGRSRGTSASGDLFQVLRATARVGRTFGANDDSPAAPLVIVLGHGAARRLFGSDSGALGRPLAVDGAVRTIIGVMPAGFDYPGRSEYWIPFRQSSAPAVSGRSCCVGVVARVRRGVSIEQVSGELARDARVLSERFPDKNQLLAISARPLREQHVTPELRQAEILAGVLAFLLLSLGVASVALMIIARDLPRSPQFAVRVALGANAWQVIRPYAAEALVLGLVTGTIGALTARAVLARIAAREALPLWIVTMPSDATVAAGWVLAVLAASASIAIPARAILGRATMSHLRGQRGGSTAMLGARVLVGLEVALTLAVLTVTTSVIGVLIRRASHDAGIRASNVVYASVYRRSPPIVRRDNLAADSRALVEELSGLPGVRSAGVFDLAPVPTTVSVLFRLPGDESFRPVTLVNIRTGAATWTLFRSLGVPLIEGRLPMRQEEASFAHVAVVSARTASALGPRGSAVGTRLLVDSAGRERVELTIIGVVGDVQVDPTQATAEPSVIYSPALLRATRIRDVFVVASGDLERVSVDVERILRGRPADRVQVLPLRRLRNDLVRKSAQPLWFLAPISAFGVLVAFLGILSVVGQLVQQQRLELGIRAALGATPRQCAALPALRLARVVFGGMVVGTMLAAALNPLVFGLSMGGSSSGLMPLAIVLAFIVVVSASTAWVPIWAAVRQSPAAALRAE